MGAKTAVVTGASSGLGLACAHALLGRDPQCHVVLAVRDPRRGEAALARLAQPRRCTVLPLDLASLASVRDFLELHARAELPPTHAVICNAGLQITGATRLSEDGFELTFAVNHLGHFALVNGLLERLAKPARIVLVSSDTHDSSRRTGMPAPLYTSAEALAHPPAGRPAEPRADRAGGEHSAVAASSSTTGRQRYTTSKLCNVLFAYELDRRLGEGSEGVAVNAFNPGLMPGSGLARDYGALQRAAWRFLMPALRVLPQVRGVERSGRDLAMLAGDAAYEGVTGRYFDGLKQIRSSVDSYDLEKARDLWETSARLTGAGGRS
jgi:NAD(P)-dependent dehydrogenase (short-subunit alcohol dehydrogenase family)